MQDVSILADAEAVARAAAEYLKARINACVSANNICHVALPGGTTPARCLELLAAMALPWQSIHWYLGDERCYPAGHAERNDRMVEQQLWSRIDSPAENLHPIPAELGAEQAAKSYASLIDRLERLDIVMLGMGEDGHTASLFPGNPALEDTASVVAVYDAPKPPAQRVSLGIEAIRAADQRIVLVAGSGKREALARVQQGEQLPVNSIGPAHWFIDETAAGTTEDNKDTE